MFTRQSRTDSGKLDEHQRHTSTEHIQLNTSFEVHVDLLRLPPLSWLPAQLRLDCHILTPGDSYTRLLVSVRIYM